MGPFTLLNPAILKRIKALEGKLSDLEKKLSILQRSSLLTWEADAIDYYNQHVDYYYLYSYDPIQILSIDGYNRTVKILTDQGSVIEQFSWSDISSVQSSSGVVALLKHNSALYGLMEDGKLWKIQQGAIQKIADLKATYLNSSFIKPKRKSENILEIYIKYAKATYDISTGSLVKESFPIRGSNFVNDRFSLFFDINSSYGWAVAEVIDIQTKKIRKRRIVHSSLRTFYNSDEDFICFSNIFTGETNKVVRKEKMDEFLDLVWEL